jgi:hypothetical protein
MAMFAVPTLESGLIVNLAPLLDDTTIACDGIQTGGFQAGGLYLYPSKLSVANVAEAAFSTLTPFQFHDAETFGRWWQANRDVQKHPWYWTVRWRTRAPEYDLDLLDSLGPEQGLRMLLLARNDLALTVDARRSAGPRLEPTPRRYGHDVRLATALFMRRHALNNKLMDLLAGEIPWPEASGTETARDLLALAIQVLEDTPTPQDLPRLKKVINAPSEQVLNYPDLHLRLTRLAITWLPAEYETILVPRQVLILG